MSILRSASASISHLKMTENGTYVNRLKTCLKEFVKSHQVNLFLAGYGH